MGATAETDWPVLTRYAGERLRRVALPLGGIGTGTVSLGGRGDLRDWEVVNRPAKGFAPRHAFFALWARPDGDAAVTRALEGPLDTALYEGARGAEAPNHSLPRFRECAFEAAYPLGQVALADPDVPLAVRLQAFNPLIPVDAARSGIPVAVLRYVLTNRGDRPVEAAVCGSLQNFVGTDGTRGAPRANHNTYREAPGLRGMYLTSAGVAPDAEQWGTLALGVVGDHPTSYRTAWPALNWGGDLLDFWDDFAADGALDDRPGAGGDAPVASLAARVVVPPGERRAVTFLLAWHFPNRLTWTPADPPAPEDRVGNEYATRYADAWDVAARTAADLPALEADTLAFVRAFCASDLPEVVKEAALCNLSTLRTQTCFRTADGRLYGWEGCDDRVGCCHGSCTHVWNYEQATPFLFADLARGMREVEFLHATRDDGLMSFRVDLPLSRARDWDLAAADGQLGCLMKLHREWRLSGDDAWLRALWPQARRALEFCWLPGGWDADRDGVLEGCQHNTMDVEYYGPNPQLGGWYLGALRAMEDMAHHLGEDGFAAECARLCASGRAWLDAHLFNGEYYEHEVRPADPAAIRPGLRHPSMGAPDPRDPDLQLGAGCLVDQLVGQYLAHVCGLGDLLDRGHVATTLTSILRHNGERTLAGHFNPLRSFALDGEAALLMATYPRGRRPGRPFPYFGEVMTGFEYTVAVHLLYEGRIEEGLRVIADIRARYDGAKRNPFDEAECGHHYARAMASWGAVLALTGFRYAAHDGTLTFAPAPGPARWFWSNGSAWGECRQAPVSDGTAVELTVLHGALPLRALRLAAPTETGPGRLAILPAPRTLVAGDRLALTVPRA
ncbi:MAG TPA: GH116 family glycosyl-hydrolase [Thermomicrobiales bacterium]|nr:GH116 family glycosyl-hydrolase [Thermomicrobiales bacterium]